VAFFRILQNCMRMPGKASVFALNRVSMRDTLLYIFILMLLSSVPDIIDLLVNGRFSNQTYESVLYLQVFLFYPLYIIFIGIIAISLLSAAAYVIKTVMKRKLTYHHLWKLTAFSATVPLLLNAVFKGLGYRNIWITVLLVVLLFFYLIKMIRVFPIISNKK